MKLLSAIVPCYNEEENVRDFYDEFIKNQSFFKEKDLDFELIYVDDGSRDQTVAEVKKLIEADSRVHLLSFSRNFGKEAAIYALPATQRLRAEMDELTARKAALQSEHRKAQREERQYDTLRQNVEALLEKPREAEPQRQRNNELE